MRTRRRAVTVVTIALALGLPAVGPSVVPPAGAAPGPETLTVPADGSTVSTSLLPAGTYLIEGSGVWNYDTGHGAGTRLADTECTTWAGDDWERDRFGQDSSGNDRGDVLVEGESPHWVPDSPDLAGCSAATDPADRTYHTYLTLDSPGTIEFRILDPESPPDYTNNSGSLSVTVTPGLGLLPAPGGGVPTFVGTAVVNSRQNLSVTNAAFVRGTMWAEYLLVGQGQYVWRLSDGSTADTECSYSPTDPGYPLIGVRKRFGDPQNPADDPLDVYVQSRSLENAGLVVDWPPPVCDPSAHIYFSLFVGGSGTRLPVTGTSVPRARGFLSEAPKLLHFHIEDPTGGNDNEGVVFVHAFQIKPSADTQLQPVKSTPADLATSASVDANSTTGTSFSLPAGLYRLLARGTWRNTGNGATLDAECGIEPQGPTARDGSPIWHRGWFDVPPGDPRRITGDAGSKGDLAIELDGTDLGAIHWVPTVPLVQGCNDADHTYETYLQVPSPGPGSVRLFVRDIDTDPTNNSGALDVDVFTVRNQTLPEAVRRYVGTVPVDSRNNPNAAGFQPATIAVDAARSHFLVAQGIWAYRALAAADSSCLVATRFENPSLLVLQSEPANNWRPLLGCQEVSHTYWRSVAAGSGSLAFHIRDDKFYTDNLGFVFVQVFERTA